jgi:hypothetical protein
MHLPMGREAPKLLRSTAAPGLHSDTFGWTMGRPCIAEYRDAEEKGFNGFNYEGSARELLAKV